MERLGGRQKGDICCFMMEKLPSVGTDSLKCSSAFLLKGLMCFFLRSRHNQQHFSFEIDILIGPMSFSAHPTPLKQDPQQILPYLQFFDLRHVPGVKAHSMWAQLTVSMDALVTWCLKKRSPQHGFHSNGSNMAEVCLPSCSPPLLPVLILAS